ncbi:MAG: GMC family oxidoreductase, partial [Actinomycetota bacterium]|nr:GMC family oxidoreductase [Actinomycetota bacterium]
LPDAPGLRSAPFHVADRRMFSEPRLEGVPHLQVVLEAPVHTLEVGADGMVRRAHVRTVDGAELVVAADAFVLAAGTASTCRLLLGSEGAGPGGLANSSGLVGRGLMDHPLVTAGWLTPDDARCEELAAFGATIVDGDLVLPKLVPEPELVRRDVTCNCWATLIPRTWSARQLRTMSALRKTGERTDAMRALGSVMTGLRERTMPKGLGGKLLTMAGGTDDLVHEWLRRRGRLQPLWSLETPFSLSEGSPAAARSLEIVQCVEQLPDDENRLTLTDRLDPAGRRQAQVHWRWSKEDSRREQAFARLVRDSLDAAGLGEVTAPITQGNRHVKQWSAHHLSGGTRMSASPSTGVVDSRGRCHDHPNLWIAGTSVFPTNGCANPTLSAVATAVIAADDIVAGLAPPRAEGPEHLHA